MTCFYRNVHLVSAYYTIDMMDIMTLNLVSLAESEAER
jgi:hypothetical protein